MKKILRQNPYLYFVQYKRIIKIVDFIKYIETYSNTGMDGIESMLFGTGTQPTLPVPTKLFPGTYKKASISKINLKKNPIKIYLSNGETWKLTKKQYDYVNSLGDKIEVGNFVDYEVFSDGKIGGIRIRRRK